MGLDQAIYSTTANKIFGIRGQWLYGFSLDGAKESETLITSSVLYPTSLCELGSTIFAGMWGSLKTYPFPIKRTESDVFSINPTTLAIAGIGLLTARGDGGQFPVGAPKVIAGTGLLWGYWGEVDNGLFFVNPSNLATFSRATVWDVRRGGGPLDCQLAFDAGRNAVWTADAYHQDIGVFDTSGGFPPNRIADTTGAFTRFPNGICYCSNVDRAYAVDSTQYITKLLGSDVAGYALSTTLIDTGVAGITPRNIRYNPYDSKVYIPTWSGNSVIVFNPATDTVESVKSGFKGPMDVVFTPTKKFAVQTSSVGLKEIV